jgi:hypothetical protein
VPLCPQHAPTSVPTLVHSQRCKHVHLALVAQYLQKQALSALVGHIADHGVALNGQDHNQQRVSTVAKTTFKRLQVANGSAALVLALTHQVMLPSAQALPHVRPGLLHPRAGRAVLQPHVLALAQPTQ